MSDSNATISPVHRTASASGLPTTRTDDEARPGGPTRTSDILRVGGRMITGPGVTPDSGSVSGSDSDSGSGVLSPFDPRVRSWVRAVSIPAPRTATRGS